MTHEEFVRAYKAREASVKISQDRGLRVWQSCGGDKHRLPERQMLGWPRSLPIWAAVILITVAGFLEGHYWRHSWVAPLIRLLAFLGVVVWAFFVTRATVIYLLGLGGFLCIPVGSFWVPMYGRSEWVGWTIFGAGLLAVLAAGVLVRRATLRFLREQALEEKWFFNRALASGALKVVSRRMPAP